MTTDAARIAALTERITALEGELAIAHRYVVLVFAAVGGEVQLPENPLTFLATFRTLVNAVPPETDYGTVRDWDGEPSTPSPLPAETPFSLKEKEG